MGYMHADCILHPADEVIAQLMQHIKNTIQGVKDYAEIPDAGPAIALQLASCRVTAQHYRRRRHWPSSQGLISDSMREIGIVVCFLLSASAANAGYLALQVHTSHKSTGTLKPADCIFPCTDFWSCTSQGRE